jgi:hypothetical protein
MTKAVQKMLDAVIDRLVDALCDQARMSDAELLKVLREADREVKRIIDEFVKE